METQEYHPCPICHNINSHQCGCCKGAGQFPYPWIKPEDTLIRKRWSDAENEVIYTALDGNDAYQRYLYIYGTAERTQSSVYRHWQYIHNREIVRPCWTASEVLVLIEADSVAIAVCAYHLTYGTARTDKAIRAKFWRIASSNVQAVV